MARPPKTIWNNMQPLNEILEKLENGRLTTRELIYSLHRAESTIWQGIALLRLTENVEKLMIDNLATNNKIGAYSLTAKGRQTLEAMRDLANNLA